MAQLPYLHTITQNVITRQRITEPTQPLKIASQESTAGVRPFHPRIRAQNAVLA